MTTLRETSFVIRQRRLIFFSFYKSFWLDIVCPMMREIKIIYFFNCNQVGFWSLKWLRILILYFLLFIFQDTFQDQLQVHTIMKVLLSSVCCWHTGYGSNLWKVVPFCGPPCVHWPTFTWWVSCFIFFITGHSKTLWSLIYFIMYFKVNKSTRRVNKIYLIITIKNILDIISVTW